MVLSNDRRNGRPERYYVISPSTSKREFPAGEALRDDGPLHNEKRVTRTPKKNDNQYRDNILITCFMHFFFYIVPLFMLFCYLIVTANTSAVENNQYSFYL